MPKSQTRKPSAYAQKTAALEAGLDEAFSTARLATFSHHTRLELLKRLLTISKNIDDRALRVVLQLAGNLSCSQEYRVAKSKNEVMTSTRKAIKDLSDHLGLVLNHKAEDE